MSVTLSEALRGVMLRDELGDGDRFVLEQAADALDRAEKPPAYANDFCAGLGAGPAAAMAGLDASMETLKSPDAALDAEASDLQRACSGNAARLPSVWSLLSDGDREPWRRVALKAREMHRRSVELVEPKHADLLRERDEWRDQWKEMARSKWSQLKDAERERDEALSELAQHDCAETLGVREAINTLERERDEARAEVERLNAALDEVGRGGPVWMNDRDGATVIRSMHAKIKEGVAEIQRLRGELDSERAGHEETHDLAYEEARAAPPIVTTVTHVQIPRADYERVAHLLDGDAAPPVYLTDIEAAVRLLTATDGSLNAMKLTPDGLRYTLRACTRPLDREGLAAAILPAWGDTAATVDAVLRHIGAHAAQPVEPKARDKSADDCKGDLDGYHAAAPYPPRPKPPEPAWTENDTIRALTAAMREADEVFERVGGSTRRHVRDCLLPVLEKHGIAVVPVTAPKVRVKLPRVGEGPLAAVIGPSGNASEYRARVIASLREQGVEVDE